ncbi:PREDICTED: zinc finger CCCH domain-containing protein 3 [Theobroma cacao]|uniref:C2H2 and C2HC zinc fingers superfamily protein, putative n=2 Tax=Theobroma cacao TaxID=3641 RepID=A0A061F352_THECC|nr:PREDICTED: zinc finger CCCH domain-containing protein 3 [Theobroma cacao]EOY11730.1 C2H2 and C2HC zinc fingers superfamily protein, putative [Theobroma cacao]
MPLGKYNCDYCEKQFQDTPSARKRHLQGLQHLRAKAQWYHSQNANDPNHSLTEPFAKGICNRFVKTGFCQFGDNCKYFHPKNDSRGANPQAAAAPAPGSVEGAGIGMSWGNLPPSLKPPPEGGYPPLPFVDWG